MATVSVLFTLHVFIRGFKTSHTTSTTSTVDPLPSPGSADSDRSRLTLQLILDDLEGSDTQLEVSGSIYS